MLYTVDMKRPSLETFKKHPYRTGVTASFLVVLATAEVMGFYRNWTHDIPQESCTSPWSVSDTYVDADADLYLRTYTGFFTKGVVASGRTPDEAYGVQASFKSPASPDKEWQENASDMIKPNGLGSFSLKMAIGDGDVQFGVRVVAPQGSPLCEKAPETMFSELDAGGYFKAPGQLPWPNPLNVLPTL